MKNLLVAILMTSPLYLNGPLFNSGVGQKDKSAAKPAVASACVNPEWRRIARGVDSEDSTLLEESIYDTTDYRR